MNLTPLLHRIIIKLDSIEEVTASGIVIPKDLIKKERKAVEVATVVSVGKTCFETYGGNNTTVKAGDRVVIAKYSSVEIPGTEYAVINDEDVLVLFGEETHD